MKRRRLEWRASRRIPLADAASCYSRILEYNAYQPHMIPHLWAAFRDDGIEVTPARECSVAILLHVPDDAGLRSRVETFVKKHFDADSVRWIDSGTLWVWWD